MNAKHLILAALLGLSGTAALTTTEDAAAVQSAAAFSGSTVSESPDKGLGVQNGLTFNGLTFNGLSFNGLTFNGVTMNGLSFNGICLNGMYLNGVSPNGVPGERLAGAGVHNERDAGAFGGLRLLASTALAKQAASSGH